VQGGCGEVVGRLWGGCGRAVIRTYIIGHIGVHPLAVVHAEIAINQICQSNQKKTGTPNKSLNQSLIYNT